MKRFVLIALSFAISFGSVLAQGVSFGGSGSVATSPSQVFQLASGASAGATTITLNRASQDIAAARGMLVIDPYTTEAELRLVTSVSGSTVTIAALTYTHASGDSVFFIPFGLVPWTLWGAKNTGSTADATTNVTAFNRLTAQIYAVGVTNGPTGIFMPNGTYYINDELRPERDQAMIGGNVNACIIQATDDFPFTADGEIAMVHPYRDGIAVKYTPDEEGAPSGRWFFRDFYVNGRLLANSNGILTSPQQPDHGEDMRIVNCLGLYALCLADCQQYIMRNWEFTANAVDLRLRGARFIYAYDCNFEQFTVSAIVGEIQPTGSASFHNHFINCHIEALDVAAQKIINITSGDQWVFDTLWLSHHPNDATLFHFDVTDSAISVYPIFRLENIRANQNSTTFKMVNDVQRGKSFNSQEENRLIPFLDAGTNLAWSTFIHHDGKVESLYQRFGTGSPEGVVAAPVGAVYHRTNGGTGTSNYFKETGTTTSSGWVAK